jgi:membrane dipeptidase
MLRVCEKYNIVLDASHISDMGFEEMAASDAPLIASHSNSRSVYDIPRNMPDRQIEAIYRKNGLIGLNSINTLLGRDDKNAGFEQILAHSEHIMSLSSPDTLCFGFDFFEGLCSYSVFTHQQRPVKDMIAGYNDVINFVAAMLDYGITEENVIKIAGENVRSFLKRTFS